MQDGSRRKRSTWNSWLTQILCVNFPEENGNHMLQELCRVYTAWLMLLWYLMKRRSMAHFSVMICFPGMNQDGAYLLGHFCPLLGTREVTKCGHCLILLPAQGLNVPTTHKIQMQVSQQNSLRSYPLLALFNRWHLVDEQQEEVMSFQSLFLGQD